MHKHNFIDKQLGWKWRWHELRWCKPFCTLESIRNEMTAPIYYFTILQSKTQAVTRCSAQGLTRLKSTCWPGCILSWSLVPFSKLTSSSCGHGEVEVSLLSVSQEPLSQAAHSPCHVVLLSWKRQWRLILISLFTRKNPIPCEGSPY